MQLSSHFLGGEVKESELFERPFEEPITSDKLLSDLDAFLGSKFRQVCSIPLYLANNDALEHVHHIKQYSCQRVWKSEDVTKYELQIKKTVQGKSETIAGHFFLASTDFESIFCIHCIESSPFLECLNRYLKRLLPRVAFPAIPQKTFKNLLLDLRESGRFRDFTISRMSSVVKRNIAAKDRHKFPIFSWPDMQLDDAFDLLEENDGFLRSICVSLSKYGRPRSRIFIHHTGQSKVCNFFLDVYRSITFPSLELIYQAKCLYEQRGRSEREDLSIKPLIISLTPSAGAKIDNNRIIASLRDLAKSSVSVLHGNPYLYLSIVDYFDGSIFDIWSFDLKQLVIAPQMKASVSSLNRLVAHIYSSLAEGCVSDYGQ